MYALINTHCTARAIYMHYTVMLENYTWYLFMLFMLIAMRSHNFVSHIKYVDIKNNIK